MGSHLKSKYDTLALSRGLSALQNSRLPSMQLTQRFILILATILTITLAIAANGEPEVEMEPEPVVQTIEPPVVMPEYDYTINTTDAYMTQDWIVYYPITAEDRRVLECIVEGEAGTEGLEGKMWVATCLLNAMKREGDASAVFVRKQYQYDGWEENVTDETITAVSRVFDEGELMHDTVLWFYAPKRGYSKWHETQNHVATVKNHKFFAPW